MSGNSPLCPTGHWLFRAAACSHSTSSANHSKHGIGYRWPCKILGWLVLHNWGLFFRFGKRYLTQIGCWSGDRKCVIWTRKPSPTTSYSASSIPPPENGKTDCSGEHIQLQNDDFLKILLFCLFVWLFDLYIDWVIDWLFFDSWILRLVFRCDKAPL